MELNLLDDKAVVSEMRRLIDEQKWDALQVLSTEHACAKQRQHLITAEAAFLASLPVAKRGRLVSIGRVNFGS